MVSPLPYARDALLTDTWVGTCATRRGRNDLQPPDRSRPRATTEPSNRREHSESGRTRAVPVFVERTASRQDAVAAFCRQWQRYPRTRSQSRRSFWRFRDVRTETRGVDDQLSQQELGEFRRLTQTRGHGEKDRAAEM